MRAARGRHDALPRLSHPARRAALDFAEQLLIAGPPEDPVARLRLTHWWQDRAGARPPRRATRLVRAARAALVRR
ncbi:hypothetical protein [Streptomyces sp. NPDC059909]|uniref:hypothetical protein n=1 Tax=Streptomyces sp. NPDC059909 TaxID=3346998 RepID=UPI00365B6E82